MQMHLFLSCTVLLLSVYGVKYKDFCQRVQNNDIRCYLQATRRLTAELVGVGIIDHVLSICRNEYKQYFKNCDRVNFGPDFQKSCSKYFPNVKQNLEMMRNSFSEAIKFICRDDAEYLSEFYKEPALCIQNTCKTTKKCEEDYPLFTFIGNYSESFCSTMDKGLNCIRETINITDCNEIEQKTLNGYYQVLKSNTPCKKEN